MLRHVAVFVQLDCEFQRSLSHIEKDIAESAKQRAAPLAVAIIDIDHFKRINDSGGHLAGDEVLRALGANLKGRIRASDSLGRYGGEEFLLVVPGAPTQAPFLPLERLQRAIAEIPFAYAGTAIKVTASFEYYRHGGGRRGFSWELPRRLSPCSPSPVAGACANSRRISGNSNARKKSTRHYGYAPRATPSPGCGTALPSSKYSRVRSNLEAQMRQL
jgi:diguanylate cyclase (GGDEF)-like protein